MKYWNEKFQNTQNWGYHQTTGKALYAGDFQLVFELCQLLKSIDMNSWHSSKTSWKSPAQSTFPVFLCLKLISSNFNCALLSVLIYYLKKIVLNETCLPN